MTAVGCGVREAPSPATNEFILLCAVAGRSRCSRRSRRTSRPSATSSRSARLGVELGLLAIALTPVIVTGGIDLSVGSMMGLAAVMFGVAYRDWQPADRRPRVIACSPARRRCAERRADRAAVDPAAHRHARDAVAVPRHRRRVTQGAVNYTGFPRAFSRSARATSWGVVPAQLPLFLVALASLRVCCIDRSSAGRCTRSASAPKARATRAFRSAGASAWSTCCPGWSRAWRPSSTWRISGQAQSDAGTGYELDAITAVVLGGTSVFGGRGTIGGTVLGLFALVRAAERPAPRGAAVGADGRADRRAAARDHRHRSLRSSTRATVGSRCRRGGT